MQINYVFSDGEGEVDNNSGVDYVTAVSGGMTAERWLQEAPQRTVRAPSPNKPGTLWIEP